MPAIVATNRLSKHYGNVKALDDCNLRVEQGHIFGLLGPNGAGKSTLIRLLLGFLRPSSGQASIAGFDSVKNSIDVRRHAAYLPGDARLFRGLRGRDVIDFFAALRKTPANRAHELAREIELDTSRRVGSMSTGMRQKLALAVTVASDTPVLILDEPTANLDPTAREIVLQWVRDCRETRRTVIFSSHVMSEIEQTCDAVAILRNGRVVHEQEMKQLRRQHRIRATLNTPLQSLPDGVTRLNDDPHQLWLQTETDLSRILQWLASISLEAIEIEPVGLASIYQRFHSAAGGSSPCDGNSETTVDGTQSGHESLADDRDAGDKASTGNRSSGKG